MAADRSTPEASVPPDDRDPTASHTAGPAQPGSPPSLIGTTFGHFRIEEELGGGGMGVVYRARDMHLDRQVALKFLTAPLAQDSRARSRFLVEARAASRIDHPNICTVHEIGETRDGRIFIAMAHYGGETLDRRIQRGPLPLAEALDVAVQTARGLASAHAHEVIHRDIKPANLIVTPEGLVKILDFGTAKTGDAALTQAGSVVGTAAYMSPEQAEGDPIDHRTDLWSLGTVLYEMIAGTPPFQGAAPSAVIYSILCEEPTPLLELDPELPAELDAVARRLLEKDARKRYSSAEELLDDLETVAAVVGAPLTPAPTGVRRPVGGVKPARRIPLAAGAVLALAVVLLMLRALGVLGGGAATSGDSYLAVLPFDAADPRDEVLAAGLSRSVTSMIADLATVADSIWVVPAAEIEAEGFESPRDVRAVFPVSAVVTGRVDRSDGGTRVTVELQDPDPERPRLLAAQSIAGPPDPSFQNGMQSALTAVLGLDASSNAQEVLQDGAADNPRAYPYYLQGEGYLRRLYQEGALESAVMLFGQALREDSTYAPALAGLCEATWEQFRRANDPALADSAVAYCQQAANLADNEPTTLVSLSGIYLQSGEAARAEQTARRALELEPDDANGFRWLGRALEAQGRQDEALAAYQRAIAIRPDVWLYREEAATLLFYDSRLDEARPYLDEVIRLSPDNYRGYLAYGAGHLLANQLDDARTRFEESIARRPTATAYRNLGYVALLEGRYDDAIIRLDQALELSATDWMSSRWLGHALHWTGRETAAQEAWSDARRIATPLLDVNPNWLEVLIGLAEIHALLGEEAAARQYQMRAAELAVPYDYMHHFLGRAWELIGERERALESIGRGLTDGYPVAQIDADPWLADLRADPAYPAVSQNP